MKHNNQDLIWLRIQNKLIFFQDFFPTIPDSKFDWLEILSALQCLVEREA